jgi:tetratricopeptide (TPR) repeat protein
MYAELYDIALDYFRRAIEIDPGFGLGHYNLGAALEGLGRHAEALAAYQRAIDSLGTTPWVLVNVARTSMAIGHTEKGDEVLASLKELGQTGVAVWLSIAMVLDALGRADEALDALGRAIDAHEPFVWAMGLEAWLKFPNARRLPRFQGILDRVGAKAHDVAGQRARLLAQESTARVQSGGSTSA